ncbi:MAG: Fe-S cluster assembly protein IscX [Pseudomonadota bacterium]
MHWNDLEDIAEALEENYPDEDIEDLRLVDLHDLVITLHEFNDDPEKSQDRVLEAILDIWTELRK